MKASSAAAFKSSHFDPGDRWFELIVEASPYAMIVIDGSQRVVLANRGAEFSSAMATGNSQAGASMR